jgi:hypothetical protein
VPAAGWDEDDVVAGGDALDSRTDVFHDAGSFMSWDEGGASGEVAGDVVQITTAHPCHGEAD